MSTTTSYTATATPPPIEPVPLVVECSPYPFLLLDRTVTTLERRQLATIASIEALIQRVERLHSQVSEQLPSP